jgi:hypothetical protein
MNKGRRKYKKGNRRSVRMWQKNQERGNTRKARKEEEGRGKTRKYDEGQGEDEVGQGRRRNDDVGWGRPTRTKEDVKGGGMTMYVWWGRTST